MNKPLKGAAALAAAAALLLGGYGTYALWSDTATLNGGTISSGELKFADTTGGTWADTTTGTPVPIPDIATFLIVPGDKLTYRLSTTVLAKGDNLAATLTADPASVTSDPVLKADVAVTTAVTIGGTPTAVITDANDGDVVDVLVTFNFSAASLNATQLKSLDLSDLALTLDQNPR